MINYDSGFFSDFLALVTNIFSLFYKKGNMNKSIVMVLALAMLISCQKDDPVISREPLPNTLHFDGENQSAPVFAQGVSYAGVRFSSAEVERLGHEGKSMTSVQYFIAEPPDYLKLLIFADNGQRRDEPGDVIYDHVFTAGEINGNAWNEHTLATVTPIPSQGVWIVFEVDAGDLNLAVIGCDPGPRHPEGDVYGLFGGDNPGWFTFFDFSDQTVDINWNIRAIVQ